MGDDKDKHLEDQIISTTTDIGDQDLDDVQGGFGRGSKIVSGAGVSPFDTIYGGISQDLVLGVGNDTIFAGHGLDDIRLDTTKLRR